MIRVEGLLCRECLEGHLREKDRVVSVKGVEGKVAIKVWACDVCGRESMDEEKFRAMERGVQKLAGKIMPPLWDQALKEWTEGSE